MDFDGIRIFGFDFSTLEALLGGVFVAGLLVKLASLGKKPSLDYDDDPEALYVPVSEAPSRPWYLMNMTEVLNFLPGDAAMKVRQRVENLIVSLVISYFQAKEILRTLRNWIRDVIAWQGYSNPPPPKQERYLHW